MSSSTGASTTTIYAKRQEPSADPTSSILAQCDNASSRISSACSCILSSATSAVVTVTETATVTEGAEVTATTTETVTTGVVATESANPTFTVPAQPIINGDFEAYATTGSLAPWTDTTATSGGTVQGVVGVNPCTSGAAYCAGGKTVIRVFPPTTGGRYVSVVQDPFVAKPSTTYSVSFMYRCLNFDTSSGIEVYYKGAKVGTALCPNLNTSAFQRVTSGIQFTTDATGRGSLEIRFINPNALPYLYVYADDFQATAV